MSERTCEGCKFGCLFDYGYSNYTTEGTEFYCAKGLHPAGHFDRFYGEDNRLLHARDCNGFEAGEAIVMDCDCEREVDLTPEQRAIYDMARALSGGLVRVGWGGKIELTEIGELATRALYEQADK